MKLAEIWIYNTIINQYGKTTVKIVDHQHSCLHEEEILTHIIKGLPWLFYFRKIIKWFNLKATFSILNLYVLYMQNVIILHINSNHLFRWNKSEQNYHNILRGLVSLYNYAATASYCPHSILSLKSEKAKKEAMKL